MEPIKDASHLFERECLVYHAERPGYRISELQISPTQQVPWHCYSDLQDTFYVIEGTSGSSCAHPRRRCSSAPAIPIQSDRAARTSSPGDRSATFLVLQGIGEYDYVPLV
jgi:hypothetical protein